jgi:hypothetical protein
MAAVIIRQHVAGVAAILAYGSCIRDAKLDESLIDLYVLTHKLEDVSRGFLTRIACRFLPPNVYYTECPYAGYTLRSKYAVMTLDEFAGRMSRFHNPYFWARFAQPSRLIYAVDSASRGIVLKAVAQAVETMLVESRKMAKPEDDTLAALIRGLKASYGTELRAEKSAARAEMIVNANRHYYTRLEALIPSANYRSTKSSTKQDWRRRKIIGKALSAARLVKAGFTFEGGADYLAWKIGRHSGEPLVMSDWHRRHPVLTGLMLLPKLLRKGAVR